MPLLLGLPGPVDRTKLLAMATKIGVGDSTRFLAKQKGPCAAGRARRLHRRAVPGEVRPRARRARGPGGRPARLHVQPDRRDRGLAPRPDRAAQPAKVSRSASARSRPVSPVSTTVSGSPIRSAACSASARSSSSGSLGQPDHPRVVAEVVVAQLGAAVQAELAHHGAGERAHQEVGEHVGAGLLLEERARAARGRRTRRSSAARAAAPARGRGTPRRGRRRCRSRRTRPRPAVRAPRLGQRPDLAGDQLRLVVQQRRQRVHVDRPAVARGDLRRRLGQRAARDQRDRRAGSPSGRAPNPCEVPVVRTPLRRRAARRTGR